MMEAVQMACELEPKGPAVDLRNLPVNYPTHRHSAEFWQALGRTVATFGFLEEILGKAIFVFTGTRCIPEDKIGEELEKWLPTLERALSDQLGGLITSYGAAVRANSSATITNLDKLLEDLGEVAKVRNVICHGSWRGPDGQGRSIPFFVNRNKEVFQTPIDVAYLQQVQQRAVELACAVINTVTQMGWQFPGSDSPGNPILEPQRENAREG
jgi:hypothetical protein